PTLPILISGLIFGLMHVATAGDLPQAIPYVMMGFVFGYAYWSSGRNIYVTMGVHFLNNFISFLIYVAALYGFIF
ncbi:MAG: CPBP family intramembrane metalloprotease, partial [Bacillota bacterium]|nr:CPBP family intramembrane metalloprotease [Bacillota bacterium]